MPVVTNRLYIIDGNALLHRAWHAIPPLTTKDGTIVNAVLGFAMVLEKLLQDEQPTHVAVCWDVAGGTFRDEVYEEYKATRETKEQELYDQIPLIEEVLAAWKIPSFSLEGYEADDLIGTVAEKVRADEETDTVIVTGDLDALQLVDVSTEVLFFVKGLSQTKRYDREAVQERYGFGPEHVVDYKALCGDTSDNIPGVKGIGAKTATDLIRQIGGVDAIYEALKSGSLAEQFSASVCAKLTAGEEQAHMSFELATIVRSAPIRFSLAKAKLGNMDWDAIRSIYTRFEFRQLLRRMEERGLGGAPKKELPSKGARKAAVAHQVDRDGSLIPAFTAQFADAERVYAMELVTHTPDLFGSSVTCLVLASSDEAFVFVAPSADTLKNLGQWAQKKRLVTYDAKRVLHTLSAYGWQAPVTGGIDLMVAGYLVRGGRQLDRETLLADLLGTRALDVPTQPVSDQDWQHCAQVAVQSLEAASVLRERLRTLQMEELYDTIEHPLIGVLFQMESLGVELETGFLKTLSAQMERSLQELTARITDMAGHAFNLNAPAQLADVLFVDLLLPTKGIKRTKSGYSTAAPELEKLEGSHPIIPLIREYRELSKLKSTYVDALPQLVGPDGRLHTSFNQTVAATGRLSSSDPNLQNIPVRTEMGREVRKAFVAPKGRTLLCIDYSQIELRLVAAFSHDNMMMKVFREGGDIHASTAAAVFGVEEAKVTKDQRRAAKAVNFGIIYGMGPRALARSIDVSFAEAKQFIETYFAAFPAVRTYLDQSLVEARKTGYAVSRFGRRRDLPELESGVQMVKAAAERMAVNMPLQGTAADVIKMAMVQIGPWLEEAYGDRAQMVLQVHDELVFEVEDALLEEVARGVAQRMQDVADVGVPLTVSVEAGKNWKEVAPLS